MPEQAPRRLAGTRVAVNLESPYLPWRGAAGRGAGTHRSASWLVANGLDAEREGVVEIYDAGDYLTWRAEQPMLLLHELTHVLMLGADAETHAALEASFESAVASGVYDAVPYVLAPREVRRRAHAMNSVGEYAAELAEALFGRNDFYPFSVGLRRRGAALVCPVPAPAGTQRAVAISPFRAARPGRGGSRRERGREWRPGGRGSARRGRPSA